MKKNTWAVLLREYLLPGAAEQDEGFQEEVLRIGHKGLRAVGGVEMGVALFLAAGRLIAVPLPASFRLRILEAASPFILGAATIALSRAQALYTWSRAVAWASCAAAAASLSWVSLLWRDRQGGADFILGPITALLLVAVAAIPLRPAHTLALGCFAGGSYALLAAWVEPQGGGHPAFTIFAAFLTLLATVLTAVIYGERRASYESWVRTVRAFEELRQAQSRILLSENAASLGRLAAALSHELNSPLGALMSGVDTLVLVAARQALSPPSEQERLVRLQADLRGSVRESAGRLQQIIERMQRFTNLDRAEVQEVDLNGLLGDVRALVGRAGSGNVTVELDLRPMPPLRCRPQQLSAVFAGLLNNALGALDQGGHVTVSTRQNNQAIEVEIRDDGRGMGARQTQSVFDPGFHVSGDRVVTGNWSMFGARQIVREHGGEIRIVSGEGKGTTAKVTLPLRSREMHA